MSRLFISYGVIQDSKVINKEIKLLHKIFPELKDVLDFIYENKGIVYSKKLFQNIVPLSLLQLLDIFQVKKITITSLILLVIL